MSQQVMGPGSDLCRSTYKFDGENYRIWRRAVEADLAVLGLQGALLPSFDSDDEKYGKFDVIPENSTDEEKARYSADLAKAAMRKRIKQRAFSYLLSSLSPKMLELVQEAETPAQIWTTLRRLYAGRSQQNMFLLMQELLNAKMND